VLSFFTDKRTAKEVSMSTGPKKIPHAMSVHGDDRTDNYFWLRERDTEPVLSYLKAENERTDKALASTVGLQEKLYTEMRKRIKEDDSSAPMPFDDYYYYARFEVGHEYPIHARKKGSLTAPEEILLNGNEMGKDHDFFSLSSVSPSPNHKIIAFTVDTVGRRLYDLQFKDTSTGQILPDKIPAITPSIAWAADNKTIFYVKQDPETLRSYQLYRYELGSNSPELVYEEKDTTFNISIEGTKRDSYLFMSSWKRDSTEVRYLPANTPKGQWTVFLPRENMHEYSLADGGDRFYIQTNWQAVNFRLMECPQKPTVKEQWKEVIAHNPQVLIEETDVYQDFIYIFEREAGLTQLRLLDRKTGSSRTLKFKDPVYDVDAIEVPNYDSKFVRFSYESLNQPPTVFDEDVATGKREVRKVREVPGFNADLYESKRLWATAPDGVKVPISMLMKKGTKIDGTTPMLLYGYGSYGLSMPPYFRSGIYTLVDRGFIYAVAHIRGGSEMGRDWYEKGRLKFKKNTFTDFIACAEYLIREKYTSKDHLHIMGGSAGGLLMGAVLNMRPDLFKSAVAQVPFVDVMTTMLDETIPLTTGEYNEWGDPRKKEDYDYMRTYSPYDNIQKAHYPNLLVTTGYHDSQVQYWEPAKWVAKLKDEKTDQNLLLLYTQMEAGHGGASGRFEALKMAAREYSFILMLEGILS
jgi:oligopeptidase B